VRVEVGEALGTIRHTYSHFSVTVHAFECHLNGGEPTAREHQAVRWVTPSRLEVYPMGKVARTIARKLVSATQTEMSHRSPRRRREKPSTVVKRREP
jgi:A/G-specific adenine glycosylase